jgi:hypothetical protein
VMLSLIERCFVTVETMGTAIAGSLPHEAQSSW